MSQPPVCGACSSSPRTFNPRLPQARTGAAISPSQGKLRAGGQALNPELITEPYPHHTHTHTHTRGSPLPPSFNMKTKLNSSKHREQEASTQATPAQDLTELSLFPHRGLSLCKMDERALRMLPGCPYSCRASLQVMPGTIIAVAPTHILPSGGSEHTRVSEGTAARQGPSRSIWALQLSCSQAPLTIQGSQLFQPPDPCPQTKGPETGNTKRMSSRPLPSGAPREALHPAGTKPTAGNAALNPRSHKLLTL